MTPARAARFARTLRSKARVAFDAGEYGRAAVLFRMAMAAQGAAVVADFGATR